MLKFVLATLFICQLVSSQTIPEIPGVKTTIFANALKSLGLEDRLKDASTLFVPTDDAFALLNDAWKNSVNNQIEWADYYKQVISYHIVAGKKMLSDLRAGPLGTESNHRTVDITTTSYLPQVNGAQIMYFDRASPKGVVHVINRVLIPQDLAVESFATVLQRRYPNTKTFLSACTTAGILPYLESSARKVVFVPTDAALAALPKGALANALRPRNGDFFRFLLNYHIVPVSRYSSFNTSGFRAIYTTRAGLPLGVTQNAVTTIKFTGEPGVSYSISRSDVYAYNAQIQIIDTLLIPFEMMYQTVGSSIAGSPALSRTFMQAVTATGNLMNLLQTAKDLTVFVPTNEAFAKLPPGYLAQLLQNTTLVRSLINAHISRAGSLTNAELGTTATSIATEYPGYSISASRLASGKLLLNNNVQYIPIIGSGTPALSFDEMHATNGLIHFVDTVFIPPALAPVSYWTKLNGHLPYNFSTFLTLANLASNVPGMVYPPIFNKRITPTTLFAPTNEAFNTLPKGYLQYLLKPENLDKLTSLVLYQFTRGVLFSNNLINQTVVSVSSRTPFTVQVVASGAYLNPYDEITFNNARVVLADVPTANGPLHVVNKVIIPPAISPLDLYSTLLANNLTEYANVVVQTNNTSILRRVGRELFTVFVPRNGLVNASSTNRNSVVSNVLNYIVNGATLSNELLQTQLITTLGGRTMNITRVAANSFVANGAPITIVDIIAKNGIIHVVNGILNF